jgi:hypothetical protein
MHQKNPTKHLRFLFGLAAVWLFMVGFLILQLWPDFPKTELGWFLLIVVGPPIYAAGEGFRGWFFSEKLSKKISKKQFSWLRVAIVFCVVAVILGLNLLAYFIFKQ